MIEGPTRMVVCQRRFAVCRVRGEPRRRRLRGVCGLRERDRLRLLVLVTALPAAVEAAILRGIGFTTALGLAPQASAIWPFGAYHDMRWLLVYHNSWPGLVVELVIVLLLRGALYTGYVILAWPEQVPRPDWRWLLRRNVLVAAGLGLLVSPWAVMTMAASVISLSWFFLGALVPVLVLALVSQRGGVLRGWWRGLPSIEMVGWSLLSFLTLTVGAALVWWAPGWWAVPVAAVAGAGNAVIWRGIVRALALQTRVRWRRVPLVPLVALTTLAAPLGLKAIVDGSEGKSDRWRPPIVTEPLAGTVRHAVIVIAGHGSAYDGRQPASAPQVVRYSYHGLDERGEPLPYPPSATFQSIDRSAKLLHQQVAEVYRRTGRPVALVGQSEGSLIARRYLDGAPHPEVDVVALFSPPVRAGMVYFPPPKDRSGWGVVAGWELRVMFALLAVTGREPDTPDEPVVRSLLAEAPFYRNQMLCPVPGIRMVAFVPTDTATVVAPGGYSGIPVLQIPSFHGGLIHQPVAHQQLVRFLEGGELDRRRDHLEYALIQRAAGAWQVPALALSVNPAWRGDPTVMGRWRSTGDAAFAGHACA